MHGERKGAGRSVGRAVTERDWAERGWAAERAQGKGRREWAAELVMGWAELVLVWVGFLIYFFSFFYSNSNKV